MFGLGVKTITTQELAEKIKAGKVVLIDVREPYEFAAGHISKAVNIPLGKLAERMEWFDKDAETFVICQSGHRSATATRKLTRAGFSAVYSVKGGTSAWQGKLKR
jgi:rhodanese-related sulfurtransferase